MTDGNGNKTKGFLLDHLVSKLRGLTKPSVNGVILALERKVVLRSNLGAIELRARIASQTFGTILESFLRSPQSLDTASRFSMSR